MKELTNLDVDRARLVLTRLKATESKFSHFRLNTSVAIAKTLLLQSLEVAVRHNGDEPSLDEVDNVADSLAEWLTGQHSKFGAVLCGNCGNGKTTMMVAVHDAIRMLEVTGCFDDEPKVEGVHDVNFQIITAKELTRMASKDEKRFDAWMKRRMVAIDELGEEPKEVLQYGNLFTPMVDLLEYRYSKKLFTLVSTNLTPTQLRDKYGERVADRMREMMKFIPFENPSFRGR